MTVLRGSSFKIYHEDDGDHGACISCGTCYGNWPEEFAEDDDGRAVFKETGTTEIHGVGTPAMDIFFEAIEACPVNSIAEID